MARYFFHVKHGADQEMDSEGLDLANDTNVRAEAIESVRSLRDEVPREDWPSWSLEVVDDKGTTILQLVFASIPLGALLAFHPLYDLSEVVLH